MPYAGFRVEKSSFELYMVLPPFVEVILEKGIIQSFQGFLIVYGNLITSRKTHLSFKTETKYQIHRTRLINPDQE